MPGGTYDFPYQPTSPYAHALALIKTWRLPEGQVVIDLGCGYGAIAGPVRDLGLEYLGIDADEETVAALAGRGVRAMVGDLTDPATVLVRVTEALAGAQVAAICALDALEHLANADDVLAAMAAFARDQGGVPLVVSIPNVSHRDLAVKLLLGRWDVTATGLLDHTHLRFFSPAGLERTMAAAGWTEVESHDFSMSQSDQHFPPDCVALVAETPLGATLRRVRQQAAPGAITNQFVRAYRPTEPASATAPTAMAGHGPPDPAPEPFCSVVVRTDGRRPTLLEDLFLSLAGQDHDDFEVVVVLTTPDTTCRARIEAAVASYHPTFARRVHVLGTQHPLPLGMAGNIGAAAARGRYVAILDDDVVTFGHWMGRLAHVGSAAPGRVLHAGLAEQTAAAAPGRWRQLAPGEPPGTTESGVVDAYDVADRPRTTETFAVGLLELLAGPPRPIYGFALPRSLFTDLGERFDEDLPALEDWDLLLRAVERCGVVTTGEIGLLRRNWVTGPPKGHEDGDAPPHEGASGHPGDGPAVPQEVPGTDGLTAALTRAQAMITAKLDADPLLLDRGGASRLVALLAQKGPDSPTPSAEVAALHAHVEHLSAVVAAAEAQLADLRASTSWRVTAPLRSAAEWWRAR